MKICPICRHCYEDTDTECVHGDHGSLVPSRHGPRLIADKYRLDRLLGRGGMGTVYLATHVELERQAAIKLLLHDLLTDPRALERFRREALAAARLNHPNVVDIYDYGLLPVGEAYIVMELVGGQTLREYLDASAPLEVGEAVLIARQVADGVEAAHRSGIVHRDLKPSNIILSRDHDDALLVKVLDFGIAKLKEHSSASNLLTATDALIGTPRYMSPEQCSGLDIDARSDIYSLGVILYEMLAGRPPFDAPSPTAVALKHVQEQPTPIHTRRENIPEPLAALVMHTLAKEPSARPQTSAEFARRLRSFEGEARENVGGGATKEAVTSDAPAPLTSYTAPEGLGRSGPADTGSMRTTPTTSTSRVQESETSRAGSPTVETFAADEIKAEDTNEGDGDGIEQASESKRNETLVSPEPSVETFVGGLKAEGLGRIPTDEMSRDDSSSLPGLTHARNPRRTSFLIYTGIVLAGLIGIGSLIYAFLRNSPNVTERSPQVERPDATNGSVTPARSPAAEVSAPAKSESQVPPSVSADVERTSLLNSLEAWVAATNARDIERQMSFYMPRLSVYYRTNNVPQASVRRDKDAVITSARSVNITVSDPVVSISQDGLSARTVFRKQFEIEGGAAGKSGEVLQELQWRKTDGVWKIIGEYDRKVLR